MRRPTPALRSASADKAHRLWLFTVSGGLLLGASWFGLRAWLATLAS